MPFNTTPFINPFIQTPVVVPFIRAHSSWINDVSVQTCPIWTDSWFSGLVSNFKFSRSEIPVFSVLLLPEPLQTWIAPSVPLDFPLDFPFFLYLFLRLWLRTHSWTMTCLDCLCQTVACPRSCLRCSLVKTVFRRTYNTPHAKRMTLFLRLTRESWPLQPLSVHANPCHSAWKHEFENQTASPRTSRLRDAHLQKVRRRLELRIRCFSPQSQYISFSNFSRDQFKAKKDSW